MDLITFDLINVTLIFLSFLLLLSLCYIFLYIIYFTVFCVLCLKTIVSLRFFAKMSFLFIFYSLNSKDLVFFYSFFQFYFVFFFLHAVICPFIVIRLFYSYNYKNSFYDDIVIVHFLCNSIIAQL